MLLSMPLISITYRKEEGKVEEKRGEKGNERTGEIECQSECKPAISMSFMLTLFMEVLTYNCRFTRTKGRV